MQDKKTVDLFGIHFVLDLLSENREKTKTSNTTLERESGREGERAPSIKTQKRTCFYKDKNHVTVSPAEQELHSGQQNALEKQLQKEIILWSSSKTWDKT